MMRKAEPQIGFHWPVAANRVIAAPCSEIWNVISSPGMLALYHPFCEQNPVRHWPGTGSVDEVHYFTGRVLRRTITDWFDDVGFNLDISRPGGRTSQVSWRIAELEERRTRISVTIYPHAVQHLPLLIRWVPHLLIVRRQLARYLDSVLQGLDWFVTMGEPVTRNQFGSHPWFSPVDDAGEGPSL